MLAQCARRLPHLRSRMRTMCWLQRRRRRRRLGRQTCVAAAGGQPVRDPTEHRILGNRAVHSCIAWHYPAPPAAASEIDAVAAFAHDARLAHHPRIAMLSIRAAAASACTLPPARPASRGLGRDRSPNGRWLPRTWGSSSHCAATLAGEGSERETARDNGPGSDFGGTFPPSFHHPLVFPLQG